MGETKNNQLPGHNSINYNQNNNLNQHQTVGHLCYDIVSLAWARNTAAGEFASRKDLEAAVGERPILAISGFGGNVHCGNYCPTPHGQED